MSVGNVTPFLYLENYVFTFSCMLKDVDTSDRSVNVNMKSEGSSSDDDKTMTKEAGLWGLFAIATRT